MPFKNGTDAIRAVLSQGVDDVGCGKGASSILMAKAFLNSHISRFDYHETVEAPREYAKRGAGESKYDF
jgi:trans-aconitate methyltransferase